MISCIAVDDEPKALEVIEIHASKIPTIRLAGSFVKPQQALDFLKSNYVDLILLDINMPVISGLEFIGRLEFKPYIIFTTAYSEYALDGYHYEVVDYLLKPIELDRFYKAIQKVEKLVQLKAVQSDGLLGKYIFIKDGYKQVKLKIEDILYIQSDGNYLNICALTGKVMARMTFQQILGKLPKNVFFRSHNSYVVNLCHIDKIEDNHIFIQDNKFPIGDRYREELLRCINGI